jgi:hypothetical protein
MSCKNCFGLDQCQARLYTAILRRVVQVMAALAICAATAALLKDRTDTQAPPPAARACESRTLAELATPPPGQCRSNRHTPAKGAQGDPRLRWADRGRSGPADSIHFDSCRNVMAVASGKSRSGRKAARCARKWNGAWLVSTSC